MFRLLGIFSGMAQRCLTVCSNMCYFLGYIVLCVVSKLKKKKKKTFYESPQIFSFSFNLDIRIFMTLPQIQHKLSTTKTVTQKLNRCIVFIYE